MISDDQLNDVIRAAKMNRLRSNLDVSSWALPVLASSDGIIPCLACNDTRPHSHYRSSYEVNAADVVLRLVEDRDDALAQLAEYDAEQIADRVLKVARKEFEEVVDKLQAALQKKTKSLEHERDEALRLLATRVEAKRLDEAQEEIEHLREACTLALGIMEQKNRVAVLPTAKFVDVKFAPEDIAVLRAALEKKS